jgi:hypothetical protein
MSRQRPHAALHLMYRPSLRGTHHLFSGLYSFTSPDWPRQSGIVSMLCQVEGSKASGRGNVPLCPLLALSNGT